MKILFNTLLFVLISIGTFSQLDSAPSAPDNWFNLDMKSGSVPGLGTNRAYEYLLSEKKSKPVIVAVIDSGVDVEHEDLQGKIWVNEDEIPNNGIDDDANGYVDDINGWNFLGGPNGDVQYDNLEFTRVYGSLHKRFAGKTKKQIAKTDKKDFSSYQKMKIEYDKRVGEAEAEAEEFYNILMFFEMSKKGLAEETGKTNFTVEDIQKLDANTELLMAMVEFMTYALENDFEAHMEEGIRHYSSLMEYSYNLECNSREIIGDNYDDLTEKYYGNNNVEGPSATHGTHVAGIIAANRNNDLGMKGVADKVQIMALRAVPEGDERDKDVANAIYYAVDNGAKVINMSFGKSYSPGKPTVDKAVAYAEEKGVLMIHAAGNSNRNNDESENFPNPVDEETRELCKTWIEVGASSWEIDEDIVGSFSNYGRKSVDIFAPGVAIHSTTPDSEYSSNDGTSMAAPMVSGVAALLFSYFPELTAKDVKNIILNSYYFIGEKKVATPGSGKLVKFKKICRSGGLANAFNAVKMAEEYKKKNTVIEAD